MLRKLEIITKKKLYSENWKLSSKRDYAQKSGSYHQKVIILRKLEVIIKKRLYSENWKLSTERDYAQKSGNYHQKEIMLRKLKIITKKIVVVRKEKPLYLKMLKKLSDQPSGRPMQHDNSKISWN